MSSHELSFIPGRHWLVDEQTGCWEWTGFRLRGYAWAGGGAHRKVFRQHGGVIPDGYDLHHGCLNRGCVNPAHMVPRPHAQHLEEHKRADSPLTEEDVIAIRKRAAAGDSISGLGREHGVHPNTITEIVMGRNWATVGGPVRVRPETYCGTCGAALTGARQQVYCDKRCRDAAYRRRRRARGATAA